MNTLDSLYKDIAVILSTYKDFDIYIGGSTALYLQGICYREPNDLDIFVPYTKEDFLNRVYDLNIQLPDTTFDLDWTFLPELRVEDTIDFDLKDIKIKVFSTSSIRKYKEDFIDLYNNEKVFKHESDLKLFNNMDSFLNKLINIMMCCWVAHWQSHGDEKLEIHDKLDELYNDIKGYIDEWVESNKSVSSHFQIFPIQVNITSDNFNILDLLKDLRTNLLEIKDVVLSDLVGRMISTCNHYIFLFSEDKVESEFFSILRTKLVDAPEGVKKSFNAIVNYFDEEFTNDKQGYQIVYVKQVGFQKPTIEDVQVDASDKDSAVKVFQKKLKKSKDIKISKVKAFGLDESEASNNYRSELRKELKGA
jgi:hypothetical protein